MVSSPANSSGSSRSSGLKSTAPAVHLRNVSKSFRTRDGLVEAVKNVNLTIHPGEIVAFLGPNGAGKTTTIDMMLGLTEPTAGTVEILGAAPRVAMDAGRVSAVMQTGGLLRDLTVRETVTAIAALHHVRSRVDEVMARADITALASRKVVKCSGGEQQRLKFALALLPNPDVLFLDEPTAGMDVNARRHFWHTIQAEALTGRTVVFATHYLEEAQEFAQRVILMAQGSLIADAPTAEFRSLASGRTVSATLSLSSVSEYDAAAGVEILRSIPGVQQLSRNGDRVEILAKDSDAVARALLTSPALADLSPRDLEISGASIENAFISLTETNASAKNADETVRTAS